MTTIWDELQRAVRLLGPPPPRGWLVRRTGLPAELGAKLDTLNLRERADADGVVRGTRYLPDGVAAIIVTEEPGGEVLGGPNVRLTIIKDTDIGGPAQ